jgi:septum formation protein
MEERASGLAEINDVGEGESPPRLILASSSPRRKALLQSLGLDFVVLPSRFEEDMTVQIKPEELVVSLALSKAQEVADRVMAGGDDAGEPALADHDVTVCGATQEAKTLVLGADTIVVLDDIILGKPVTDQDACRMLAALSGRCHQVYTGVAIIRLPQQRIETSYAVSSVFFRPMEQAEIESYVRTGEPMDKAGAYALQGIGSAFVEKIEGCFTNVIGLPVPLVMQILRRFGVQILGLPS